MQQNMLMWKSEKKKFLKGSFERYFYLELFSKLVLYKETPKINLEDK